MAIGTEARSTFLAIVKGDASQAITEFKKLEGTVTKSTHGASGSVGKFQSAMQGLKAELKSAASSPLAMGVALTAVAAGGLKAANAFSDLAKQARDLGAATGLSIEQASKWIAVADDFGVSADALQTGIGRIGKTLESAKWAEYGVATRDASGSALSANEIFVNALDTLGKITNETERAKVGNELFGKGYANLAPIIGSTRAEYERMLSSVSDGQIVTAGEAERAEKWRLAQDRLGDALGDLVMAFGSAVAAAGPLIDVIAAIVEKTAALVDITGEKSLSEPLTKFSKTVKTANGNVGQLVNAFADLSMEAGASRSALDKTGQVLDVMFAVEGAPAARFENYKRAIKELAATAPRDAGVVLGALTELALAAERTGGEAETWLTAQGLNVDRVFELGQIAADTAGGVEALGISVGETSDITVEATTQASKYAFQLEREHTAIKGILDELDRKKSFLDVQQAVSGLDDKLADLTTRYEDGKISAEEYWFGVQEASLDTQSTVANYLDQLDKIPASVVSDILTRVENGDLEYALTLIDRWRRLDNGSITLTTRYAEEGSRIQAGTGLVVKRANGGRSRGGLTLVGEYGPEMVNLPAGAMVSTAAQTRQMMSGGGGITVVVNAPVGANMIEAGRQVADALNDYYRSGGQRVA